MSLVNSYNEWDPLEEIIVGKIPDDMCIPEPDALLKAHFGEKGYDDFLKEGVPSALARFIIQRICRALGYYKEGFFYGPVSFYEKFSKQTRDDIQEAKVQLENFVTILSQHGITVKRPSPIKCIQHLKTPFFETRFQSSPICPRDILLVVGDTIIEGTMATRARQFEHYSYRKLLTEYFDSGCKWLAAPKGMMSDALYRDNYPPSYTEEREQAIKNHQYITNDSEIIFEAADVARCGKDLFVQHGFTTNKQGINWLKRTLGDKYRVHPMHFRDNTPIHIDASLTLLRPGLMLANPDRPLEEIDLFTRAGWKILEAPKSVNYGRTFGACTSWLLMNVLSLDPNTIVVEATETPLIRLLESQKFRVIPVPFTKVYPLGGSFHCVTSDVRRKSSFEDYFPKMGN